MDRDSTYNYRAFSFPSLPRTDTITLKVSNGFNESENIWLINVDNPTSISETSLLPEAFRLLQNYPNPFNPSTSIKYELPEYSKVVLKVYDLLGREIKTLVNEEQSPGYYNLIFNGAGISSGTYFYRLQSEKFVDIKTMLLLK